MSCWENAVTGYIQMFKKKKIKNLFMEIKIAFHFDG